MGLFESRRKKQIEDIEKAGGGPIEGPTTEEILHDPEQEKLFAAYLGTRGTAGTELAKRLAGKIDVELLRELGPQREAFLKRIGEVEETKKSLDQGAFAEVIRTSKEFRDLSGSVNSSTIHEAIMSELTEIAIIDPKHFEDIRRTLAKASETKQKMAEKEKEINKLLGARGISRRAYEKAVVGGDDEAVRELFMKSRGFLAKTFGFTQHLEGDISEVSLGEVDGYLKQLDKDYAAVAGILENTLGRHPGVTDAIEAAFERNVVEKENNHLSYAEMKNEIKKAGEYAKTNAGMLEWGTWKLEHENEPGWNEEKGRMDFANNYSKRNFGEKRGIWKSAAPFSIFDIFGDILK